MGGYLVGGFGFGGGFLIVWWILGEWVGGY